MLLTRVCCIQDVNELCFSVGSRHPSSRAALAVAPWQPRSGHNHNREEETEDTWTLNPADLEWSCRSLILDYENWLSPDCRVSPCHALWPDTVQPVWRATCHVTRVNILIAQTWSGAGNNLNIFSFSILEREARQGNSHAKCKVLMSPSTEWGFSITIYIM